MSAELLTYSLNLGAFGFEFIIHVRRSVEETRAFQIEKPPEFAFVVAKIELRLNNTGYLVSSEFNTGNLAEFLKDFAAAVLKPQKLRAAAGHIARGGLCAWMKGYWQRIERQTAALDDEAVYDSLISSCVTSEDGRCIAVYDYDGTPTLEVSAGATPQNGQVMAVVSFDPTTIAREIDQLREIVTNVVRRGMTVQ